MKPKLELTWIGKENRPRLEPRILLEDSEHSYHAAHRVTEHDLFDNWLARKSAPQRSRRSSSAEGSMLKLGPRLAAIHAEEYPRFSDAEMARRRAAPARVMADADVDHLLVCGEQRAGTGVAWLTGWPTTVEAYVIVAPPEPQVMYIEWYNHWPNATKLARDTEVRWGEHQGLDKVVADLTARGAKRVGLMGALGYTKCQRPACRSVSSCW